MGIEVIIAIIVLVAVLIIAAVIVATLKKRFSDDMGFKTKYEVSSMSVEMNKPYITTVELKFFNALISALPIGYVAFPKVGIANIVKPKGNKVLFNTILAQHSDFCVFKEDGMEPVIAVDFYDANSPIDVLEQIDSNVEKALTAAKIPVMKVQLKEDYNITELRKMIIDKLPQKMVALMKENYKNK